MSTLLVAQGGGHLQELHRLLPRLEGIDTDRTWVTPDTAQARSLLADQQVLFVPRANSRDLATTVRNLRPARALLRSQRFDYAVSTGSSIAVSFLPLARLLGASCHYIESAARVEGPSVTARILRAVPRIRFYTQHQRWLRPPWRYEGSIFDGFMAEDAEAPSRAIKRVVVSVGMFTYGFESLVRRMVELLPADVEVLWQTGSTDVGGLDIRARPVVPPEELAQAMRDADVVVGHAGIGTILMALDAGRWPILVPRRLARGEHVDDHQMEIAAHLERSGLAMVREIGDLRAEDLTSAIGRRVRERVDPAPFRLDP